VITPPAYLSPSSIETYRQCPQKFKLSRIDRISEPPTWFTHLGTFVHDVLEHMYQQDPDQRTLEHVRALAKVRWADGDWQNQVESLAEKKGTIADFKNQAFACMSNLFTLEDPAHTEFDGMEHNVSATVEGVALRGIIDRFTFGDDGITISDYKTGKVPNDRFKSEDDKFFQLLAYALMLQEADQEETSKVQLLYLAKPVVHELSVTPVKLSIAKGTIVETKEGVDNSCESGVFHCNVGTLCDWCFYKKTGDCPAFKK
jgi:putative RecB family exonuclease